MTASMAAVNFNNSNYLASVVCPYIRQDALDAKRIGELKVLVAVGMH